MSAGSPGSTSTSAVGPPAETPRAPSSNGSTAEPKSPLLIVFTLWLLVFSSASQTMIISPILPMIGAELDITYKTVEAHRAKIMKKMGARSVAQLIHMAHLINLPGTEERPAENA